MVSTKKASAAPGKGKDINGSSALVLLTSRWLISGSEARCSPPILARGKRQSLPVSSFFNRPSPTSDFINQLMGKGKELRTVASKATSALSLGSTNAASRMAVPPEDNPKAPSLSESIAGWLVRNLTAARMSATHWLMFTWNRAPPLLPCPCISMATDAMPLSARNSHNSK